MPTRREAATTRPKPVAKETNTSILSSYLPICPCLPSTDPTSSQRSRAQGGGGGEGGDMRSVQGRVTGHRGQRKAENQPWNQTESYPSHLPLSKERERRLSSMLVVCSVIAEKCVQQRRWLKVKYPKTPNSVFCGRPPKQFMSSNT